MRDSRSIAGVLRGFPFALMALALIAAGPLERPRASDGPFSRFDLPDEWEASFWGHPDAQALLKLDPKALVDLVPTQAGLRFCQCPGCDLDELEDPLLWSIRKPGVVTCKRCGTSYPNEKVPAQVDKKVPEETIEVVPGVTHKYPYHKVDAEHQRRDDDRLYLSSRRDYAAREYLAKAALYAAVRHRDQPQGAKEPTLARVACLLILRFAQVYPNYALHLDQPGQPKFFEPAHQPPPYRTGYRTAKWDWSGALDVPINLAIAYALIRDDPEMARAGQLLHVTYPNRTIEVDLFRASAAFTRDQPQEVAEPALQVARGLLTVGRVVHDPALIDEAITRLGNFAEQGFYHDGLWRGGDSASHRRVVGMLDGWFDHLLAGLPDTPRTARLFENRVNALNEGTPMLSLARSASSTLLTEAQSMEIQQVGWPSGGESLEPRHPGLLGGSGVARLAVGQGFEALDLELRGMGQHGESRSRRQALRLSLGGKLILGDLDDLAPRADGWDRASSSHNTVIVDNLNQRETPRLMQEAASGGDFLFFAADPDFQVTVLDDRQAYPRATSPGGYRQTLVVCSGKKTRYAVSVFEVQGGHQHDQLFHASAGSMARWMSTIPMKPGPESLLDPNIPYLTSTRVEDGRWFVQSYGEFVRMAHGLVEKPGLVELAEPGKLGVRLHLLGDVPYQMITASTPRSASTEEPGRPALILRRTTTEEAPLTSTFVTVYEPIAGPNSPSAFAKVGRMTETPGWVVLYLETPDGPEHLAINLRPGSPRVVELADGRELTTDGRVVRARRDNLFLAGGTFASASGIAVRQPEYQGRILAVARFPTSQSRGWFETDTVFPNAPNLTGRTLIIRHGDRSTHAWTIARVEPSPNNRFRIYVVEEPGFRLEGDARNAHYYQFPGTTSPGPHSFNISTIAR